METRFAAEFGDHRSPPSGAVDRATVYTFGPYEFDSRSLELKRGRRRIRLAPKPAEVLRVLLRNAGHVVLRRELRDRVWPAAIGIDFDHSVNTCVLQIRRALHDAAEAPTYIETVHRRGYRFRAPVECQEADWQLEEPTEVPGRTHDPRAWQPLIGLAAAAAISLLALSVSGVHLADRFLWRRGGPLTVVVTPFADLSVPPDSTFFAQGLVDDIVAALATVHPRELRLVGRATTEEWLRAFETEESPPVNVDYVVRGSVRRSGTGLRVVASVQHLEDGETIWAQRYDLKDSDGLGLQALIASDLARVLSVSLNSLAVGSVPGPGAQRALAIGRYLLRQADPAAGAAAISQLQAAVAADSDYAPALAYLAEAHLWFGDPHTTRALIVRALAQDSLNAHVQYVAGLGRLIDPGGLMDAERHARQAVALAPGKPDYHSGLAYVLAVRGKHREAIREIEAAYRLDPISPTVSGDFGLIYYWAGQYGAAAAASRRTLNLHPREAGALNALECIVNAEMLQGDTVAAANAAADWIETAGASLADIGWPTQVDPAAQLTFFRRWRLQHVESARKQGLGTAFEAARYYADLGMVDEAFAALSEAGAERSVLFPSFRVEPRFTGLRHDPRFAALLATYH